MARLPDTWPCLVRPERVCEILSRGNAGNDLWDKMGLYHQAGISHYWIVDPATESLRRVKSSVCPASVVLKSVSTRT